MSVQSRRKPSRLTVYGSIWVVLLAFMIYCVWRTLAEMGTQAVWERAERLYILLVSYSAVVVFCRMLWVEAPKRQYLTVQLVNFTVFLGGFWVVLDLVDKDGLAFFLGNPVPGVVSVYEAVFIAALSWSGATFQMLSVMNDKYQNKLRISVGGILFIISIFLPKLLDSYALVRASCTSPLSKDAYIEAQCQERALETIPMFAMAIASSAALLALFFIGITIERFNSSRTGPGTDSRTTDSLSDTLEGAGPERNLPEREPETAVLPSNAEPLPSAVRRNNHFGSFTAAVLGGIVVWMIQTVGKRPSGPR